MKFEYEILGIKLDRTEDDPCVRATVRTWAGEGEILEWLTISSKGPWYTLAKSDANDNSVVIDKLFPNLYEDGHFGQDCQKVALGDMWLEIIEWVFGLDELR